MADAAVAQNFQARFQGFAAAFGILAATTDSSVIQGRIAIDQAVRILEGKPYQLHVGPVHFIVDRSNISHIDREALLAPKGFEPVLNVD